MLIQKLIGEVNEVTLKLLWRTCQHLVMITLFLIVLCVFIQIILPGTMVIMTLKKLIVSLIVTYVVLILVKPIKYNER